MKESFETEEHFRAKKSKHFVSNLSKLAILSLFTCFFPPQKKKKNPKKRGKITIISQNRADKLVFPAQKSCRRQNSFISAPGGGKNSLQKMQTLEFQGKKKKKEMK